jgi:thioredoxin 2
MPEERLNQKPLCGNCHELLVLAQPQIRPVEVTDNTFTREVLAAETSVLVDCWAPWCAPCRKLAPIIDELASDYANGVKMAKLNVDENPVTASQYGIHSIPTLLLFKDGKLVQRLVGVLPKEEIEKNLLSIIKAN